MKENENLYKCMMEAIRSKHTRGNAVGYFKLPMIFSSSRLYGGAISQFYLLTAELEQAMEVKQNSNMIKFLRDNLKLKPLADGYESDLQQ